MRVIKIFLISILVLLVTVNVILVSKTIFHPKEVPGVLGYKPFIVLSGSMSPTFNYGDLIVVKEVDYDDLKVGDVVSFRNSKKVVTTHRIYGEKNGCFETKGDNNNDKDRGIVCEKHIEGKYIYRIIGLGSVILFIQKPIGFISLMVLLIGICVYIYLYEPKKNIREKGKKYGK